MKIDRHRPRTHQLCVKLISGRLSLGGHARWIALLLVSTTIPSVRCATADEGSGPASSQSAAGQAAEKDALADGAAHTRAAGLLGTVLHKLVYGPAFDAKVRETVWTNGREVVGVGTYEQAGGGSGRYKLQITMHDGDGKHRLQQVSDGRLVWTRSEIAGRVDLRRVDVGRLDQWVKEVTGHMKLPPRLKVGAWAEMLSSIERDYQLRVEGARLKDEPVWVITGHLSDTGRKQVLADSGRDEWPMLYPARVRVAVKIEPDKKTNFGDLLPVRIEFWSDPVAGGADQSRPTGRLITLIEVYSLRPIPPPPVERFRFENQDAEVNFVNDTDRYIRLYGVRLTDRQRRQLRR